MTDSTNNIVFLDSLANVIAGLGTAADRLAGSHYVATPWTDEQINNAYRFSWLAKKIVDIPAMEAVRKWRDWQADAAQITAIEFEEGRLSLRSKVHQALTKARLFGGAAIYIGTDDADLTKPLDPSTVRKDGVRYLNVLSARTLTAGEIERDPQSPWFGKPKHYQLQGKEMLQIHPSRFVVLSTDATNDDEIIASSIVGNAHGLGWGDSVLVSALDAIRNVDATAANIANLVFQATIDVVNIPELMQSLADKGYERRLMERFTLASHAKSNLRTLILDADETYDRKSAQFTTLPDVMDRFIQMVAGAADIPVTRLLGQSPAGMNSTGESDLRNYYDRISSMQTLQLQPAMSLLDECLIRSALGTRPPEIFYTWSPLWQISDKERAEIGKIASETASNLVNTGLYTAEELRTVVTNQLVEGSIYPGLDGVIAEQGSEWESELEEEAHSISRVGDAVRSAVTVASNRRLVAEDSAPRTLYVRRDVVNRGDVVAWAEGQGFTDIVPDLHVTIAYSRALVNWFAMGESWSPGMEVAAGGPRQVEAMGPTGDYKAILFTANELVWRHKAMVEAGASWEWPEYQPHITIQIGGDIDLSKVTPYRGPIILGPEIFEEVRN